MTVLFIALSLWGLGALALGQIDGTLWEPAEVEPPPVLPNYRFVPFEYESEAERPSPVRRWSLIPTVAPRRAVIRTTTPVQTTTSTTTSTTTTPMTTTVKSTTPATTTADPCEYSDDGYLMKRLKENGLYNALYMAVDVQAASVQFKDLADRTFTISRNAHYRCDGECQRQSSLARKVMPSGSRSSLSRAAQTPSDLKDRAKVTEAPRTWWRPDNWRRRGKRQGWALQGGETVVFRSLEAGVEEERSGPRSKRSAEDLARLNTGTTDGVLGTTIALECDEATLESVPSTGYHLCRTCRAIRQLPLNFFPRILNEVVCAEGACLRNEGKCTQRFLPFKILENVGDSRCPRWRETNVQIRTCCDCVIHPNSPFLKYILPSH